MRAIIYSQHGHSSVLELVDREPATPGPDEVRVRVAVSGVNPTDWKARAGGRPLEYAEIVPNQDGAGVVDAVGPNVTDLKVGDRVWLFLAAHQRPTGTAQEFTVVPASRVVRLPDGVGFDVAASIGVPAMTAHRALTVHEFGPARLAPGALDGRVVLVQGGAGAVGHAAIQLAVWAGATVVATVSSDGKADLARAAGAHHVVQYPAADLSARIISLAPDGVDHIVEVAPAQERRTRCRGARQSRQHRVLREQQRRGVHRSDRCELREERALARTAAVHRRSGGARRGRGRHHLARSKQDALPVGEESGLPLTWFPLEETASAHDAVESGVTGQGPDPRDG